LDGCSVSAQLWLEGKDDGSVFKQFCRLTAYIRGRMDAKDSE